MPSTPPTPTETLTTLHTHLHTLHHRNKNQHRLAKWYKSLTQLKRQCLFLITDIHDHQKSHAVSGKSKHTKNARDSLRARVEFLGRGLIGKMYLAFSTIVADNQYSALGLMLIGSLGRFHSVVRQVGEGVGVNFDLKSPVDKIKVTEEVSARVDEISRGDDFGEVVGREVVDCDESNVDEASSKRGERKRKIKAAELEAPVKRLKKKKKKGDAFDDLFGSLI